MGTLDPIQEVNADIKLKQKDFDNTDTFPLKLWDPAGTKKAMIHNIVVYANNKATSSTLNIKVEVDRKGTWYEIASAGVRNLGVDHMVVDYKGLLRAKELRIRKVGTSTNFNGFATATGEVVD